MTRQKYMQREKKLDLVRETQICERQRKGLARDAFSLAGDTFFLVGNPFSLLDRGETKRDLERETQICEIRPKVHAGDAYFLPKTHLGEIKFVVREIHG